MSRVNHRCVRIDCVSQLLRCLHKNQLGSREPNGIVKSTPAAHHDDFILQSVVSGSCQIYFGSLPAMHAAAADAIAPAAPEVTMPASAPVNSARRRLAACCNSNMLTKYSAASRCAACTSGNSSEPLKYVQVPRQLMMVFTPRRV